MDLSRKRTLAGAEEPAGITRLAIIAPDEIGYHPGSNAIIFLSCEENSMALVKKTLLFLMLLLPLASYVSGQSTKELDEKFGFRDLKFYTPLDSVKEAQLVSDVDGLVFYKRPDDVLKIGDYPVAEISYGFYDKQLAQIVIQVEELMNSRGILNYLKNQYGTPSQPNEFMQRYFWMGEKVILYYKEDPVTGDALIAINSSALFNKMQADKKNKRASDF